MSRSHKAFDPIAENKAKRIFGNNLQITYFENNYDALKGADCMALITEWSLSRNPDFDKMKAPIIFDGRNQYDPMDMKERGFKYFSIGRK